MPTFAVDYDKNPEQTAKKYCNKLSYNTVCSSNFCPASCSHRPRENRYSRRSSGKCGHPSLKQSSPKHKRVFPNKDEIDQLKNCKLVQKDAAHNCNDKPSELGHNLSKILNTQYFGTNNTSDSDR